MKYQVVVQLRSSTRLAVSPWFELDEAEKELVKVREHHANATPTSDVSWLVVNGGEILSASAEPVVPNSSKKAAFF